MWSSVSRDSRDSDAYHTRGVSQNAKEENVKCYENIKWYNW
jgi:hypothetical protein